MEKLKIAFFVDVLEENFDGVAHTYHHIIPRIPTEKIEVIFITPLPPKSDIGFKVVRCPYIFMPLQKRYRIGLPKMSFRVKNALNDFNPDIVHYSSPSGLGKYAIKYAQKRKIPVTNIYHTHFPSYFEYYVKRFPLLKFIQNKALRVFHWYYQNTDQVFAPSSEMKTYLESIGFDAKNIAYFKRGVNAEKFSPTHKHADFRSKYNIKEKNIILFVSRLVYEKDIETLVKVYDLFEESTHDAAFLIVGEGAGENFLKKKMPKAYFSGKLTGTDLAEAYANSTLFLFPSISETFGNVVLESLASGTPVVAAKAGGPVDIVKDNENGFLVEPKNEHAFFNKLSLLLQDDALLTSFEQNARKYALSQTWNAICGRLFLKFEELN